MIKETAKTLERLLDLYPIDLSDPQKMDTKMREGLARAYADLGMRTFLENAIKLANMKLIKAKDNDEIVYYRSRLETLMKLIVKAKVEYIQYERIQSNATKEREQQKDSVEEHI